jgi:hypothetical protein
METEKNNFNFVIDMQVLHIGPKKPLYICDGYVNIAHVVTSHIIDFCNM